MAVIDAPVSEILSLAHLERRSCRDKLAVDENAPRSAVLSEERPVVGRLIPGST
jgi:hypothetical protein